MPDDPVTVEIAVPYVGSEPYLRLAVDSVRAQSDPDWSLFVLVDGPEQPAVEDWLDSLDDPRIRHERSPVNRGVAASFQRCLEAGSSSHVTILGCDDVLLPTYVETVRAALRHEPDCFAVLPEVEVIDAEGRPASPLADRIKGRLAPRRRAGRTRTVGGQRLLGSLMVGNWTYFPLTCWDRRRALGRGFRPDLTVVLDLALWAALVLDGGRLALPTGVAGAYRRHEASVSSTTAADVSRFAEEAGLHREIAAACGRRWPVAALLARLRPTSRLHAALHLLAALRARDLRTSRRLLRFVVA